MNKQNKPDRFSYISLQNSSDPLVNQSVWMCSQPVLAWGREAIGANSKINVIKNSSLPCEKMPSQTPHLCCMAYYKFLGRSSEEKTQCSSFIIFISLFSLVFNCTRKYVGPLQMLEWKASIKQCRVCTEGNDVSTQSTRLLDGQSAALRM